MTAPSRLIIMGMKLIICHDRGRVCPPCLLFSLCLFIATLLHCFWRIDKANHCYTAPSLCKGRSSDTYIHIYNIVLDEPARAQAESPLVQYSNIFRVVQCGILNGWDPLWSRNGPDLQDVGGVSIIGLSQLTSTGQQWKQHYAAWCSYDLNPVLKLM